MKKLLLHSVALLGVLSLGSADAGTNVALSQFLNDLRGTSFNMLIAKPHIDTNPKYKRTRKSIKKGYVKEGRNMQILLRRLELNARLRAPGMRNDLPAFLASDKEVGKHLLRLIEEQTRIWETRLSQEIEVIESGEGTSEDAEMGGLSDDIGTDIDFDSEMIEMTDDLFEEDGVVINPGQVANDIFLEVGDVYAPQFAAQEVTRTYAGKKIKKTLSGHVSDLEDIFAPFEVDGYASPLPLHAVFGTSFLPDKKGALHVMRMYVFVIINDPEIKRVRVAAKPISEFRWDRNEYYISAATGSVLRTVFSEALGTKVDDI